MGFFFKSALDVLSKRPTALAPDVYFRIMHASGGRLNLLEKINMPKPTRGGGRGFVFAHGVHPYCLTHGDCSVTTY